MGCNRDMKCQSCPSAEECAGECHKWICDLIKSDDPVLAAHAEANLHKKCTSREIQTRSEPRLPRTVGEVVAESSVIQPKRHLSIKRRAKMCIHRDTLNGCGCDGYCSIGRGVFIEDIRDGIKKWFVTLDDCSSCEHIPKE